MKLATALTERADLQTRLSVMRDFLNNASQKIDRYSRAEIKIVSTVSVEKLQKQTDDVAKQLRLVDEKIQELNWTTELI